MGWKLFVHSVRMVLDNLDVALRLSGLLYLVQAGWMVFIYAFASGGASVQETPAGAGELLIMGLFAIVSSLWIAVGWHRFVLSGEAPAGVLPRWHGAEIMSYLLRSVGLALILGLGFGVVGGLVLGIVSVVPGLIGVVIFGLVGLASYLFFRIGLSLPAAALGEKLSLRESWEKTSPGSNALLQLALLVIVAGFVIEIPGMIDGNSGGVVSLIYNIVINWFVTMFSVSLLTTLYGHYVEGRRID